MCVGAWVRGCVGARARVRAYAGDTGQLFAVMEPAVVYKAPPKIKGGPDQVPPPPVPATTSFRLIKPDGAVVRVHCLVPRTPAFLFSGPLLGVALVADAVAAVSGDVAGACNRRDGRASVNMQFYDWTPPPGTAKPAASGATTSASRIGSEGTLRAVGSNMLPTPSVVAWSGGGSRVAMCLPSSVHVYAVAPEGGGGRERGGGGGGGGVGSVALVHLCSVPAHGPSSVLWFGSAVFVATSRDILAVFPPPVAAARDPRLAQFSAALGLHGTVALPLATLCPTPPTLDVVPVIANAPNCVLLTARHGHVLAAVSAFRNTSRPRRSADLRVFAIPLQHAVVRMCMAASAGRADVVGHWATSLPPRMHSTAAVILSVRVCMCVCVWWWCVCVGGGKVLKPAPSAHSLRTPPSHTSVPRRSSPALPAPPFPSRVDGTV